MKVLLFTGYGDSICTPKMKEIMKLSTLNRSYFDK